MGLLPTGLNRYTGGKKNPDGYDNLAIGIIKLAAEDYRIVCRGLRRQINDYDRRVLLGAKAELERFFKSEYADILCYGRALEILQRLKEEENG